MTLVLTEPFDSLANWTTTGGTAALGTGDTGLALRLSLASGVRYTIPAISESDTVVIGTWVMTGPTLAASDPIQFFSDSNTTNHISVRFQADGSVVPLRGGAGFGVPPSPVNTWAASTAYYLEARLVLSDTVGSIEIRLNGVAVINASGLDTKFGGTKTTIDTIRLNNAGAGNYTWFDDLYIKTGAGETFSGQTRFGICTDVLTDHFDNLANWSTAAVLGPGRYGTALQMTAAQTAVYTIPSAAESYQVTVGFAFRTTDVANTSRVIARLNSDSNATVHTALRLNADGSLSVIIGASTVRAGPTAPGIIIPDSWYFIEFKMQLHDTGGAVQVLVNGTAVLSASDIDTKNAGTKTTYDTLNLYGPGISYTTWYDDLYLKTGTICAYQGDLAPLPGQARNFRQSARVGIEQRPVEARNVRQSVRVAFGTPTDGGNAQLAQISERVLIHAPTADAQLAQISERALIALNPGFAQLAQLSMRALITVVAIAAKVKVWNGSAFVDAPVKVWDGSAFVDALAVKTWDGSAFV